jgi:hypothetical protein
MGDLVLEEGQAFGELVGVAPFHANARAAGLVRVAPGEPDGSFLVIKVEGPPLELGFRMPLVGDPLSAEEIRAIRDWIAAGAKE